MNNKSKDESKEEIVKYKELYDLSREVFSEELSRSARIDNKASKYLTVITFLLGAYAFFCKRILDSFLPPTSLLEWILVVISILLLIFLTIAWFITFEIIVIHEFRKIPIDIDFFDHNELKEIYYGLSVGIKNNLITNRDKINRKSKKLYYSYNLIRMIVVTLVILSVLFAVHAWLNPQKKEKYERRWIMMSEDPKKPESEKPTEPKPKPHVKPPDFDLVTEGFNPSGLQKKGEKSRD